MRLLERLLAPGRWLGPLVLALSAPAFPLWAAGLTVVGAMARIALYERAEAEAAEDLLRRGWR